MKAKTKIGVFTSGGGTNLQSLIDAVQSGQIPGEIVLVLSSNPTARSLTRAKDAKIQTAVLEAKNYPNLEAYATVLSEECKKHYIELVCLAGFMHQLGASFIKAYHNHILNIHPAI